jgi:NAD(P)H-dependent FMN reductase
MPRLLTISGSLRAGSSNAVLLEAACNLLPAGTLYRSFDRLAELPAFNPDIEEQVDEQPAAVMYWRNSLSSADAVLISCPEYAHGIPGAFKNALDWVVGSGEFVDKPTGLLSASSASRYAHPQLIEVLTVMSARVVPSAVRVIDIPRRGATAADIVANEAAASALRDVAMSLLAASVRGPA